MKYQSSILFLFPLFVLAIIVRMTPMLNNELEAIYYDYSHPNPSIHNKADLEKILNQFEKVSIKELPENYLVASKMKHKKYSTMVADMRFYQITKQDSYKKIIGELRIKDFIVKDHQLSKAKYHSTKPIFWGIKPAILFKLFELKKMMEKRNLDFNAITINSGHRTPQVNEKVGGASKSKHIVGEAIDLKIGDVDKDGKITIADKNKILKICDLELIGNQGGVGKYPGTSVIHIDTRGYRARWDTY